jgi:hypothetical protein
VSTRRVGANEAGRRSLFIDLRVAGSRSVAAFRDAGPSAWLKRRDANFAALRRAGRTAIVMPGLFALGVKVIGSPVIGEFAAFGSFALLLMAGFAGSFRERLQAQATLAVASVVLVCVGTAVSSNVWAAVIVTVLVSFLIIFAGVVSSVMAGATTSLLLALMLALSLPGSVSSLPDRLAGWGIAAAVSLAAIVVLWPLPVRDPLRIGGIAAIRALAARLRSEATCKLGHDEESLTLDLERAVARAAEAVATLERGFFATPYRPTALGTAARTVLRLVDEVIWLDAILAQSASPVEASGDDPMSSEVRVVAAAVLERGADLLELTGGSGEELGGALAELSKVLSSMEIHATERLGVLGVASGDPDEVVAAFIRELDPSFRAQELAFAVSLIGRNIEATAAAERRGWAARLLGSRPQGLGGPLSLAQERAAAHVERHSVSLRNSVRGAVGLGLAVAVAHATGVQHAFWVLFGTLSILRSNALSTGQTAARALIGTLVGFTISAALLVAIGSSPTVLWLILPLAVLIAGVAPAAISYTAGQAAFTATMVILFNLVAPVGWRIGLIRVEDVALGAGVSLVVGILFWPSGARAALRQALAEAYLDSATYLVDAVNLAVGRCHPRRGPADPTASALKAAASARRLDDTFRTYLAERGAKPVGLAEVTTLVNGVAGVRLASDAVASLWRQEVPVVLNDDSKAPEELQKMAADLRTWYGDLAGGLIGHLDLRPPPVYDEAAARRLARSVLSDLQGERASACASAIRVIWTADHLDVARRLGLAILPEASAAVTSAARRPGEWLGFSRIRSTSKKR